MRAEPFRIAGLRTALRGEGVTAPRPAWVRMWVCVGVGVGVCVVSLGPHFHAEAERIRVTA